MSETIQAVDNKVYSNDGNVWVGMTKDDAKSKFGNIGGALFFNNIDKDKNNELSAEEINIYNGPSLKYDNPKGQDSYFYPELEISSLTEDNDKKLFQKLDKLPEDGVLSENEIQEEIKKVEEYEKKRTDVFDKTLFTTAGITAGSLAAACGIAGRRGGAGIYGIALGGIVGFCIGGILGGLIGNIRKSFVEKNSEFEIETK